MLGRNCTPSPPPAPQTRARTGRSAPRPSRFRDPDDRWRALLDLAEREEAAEALLQLPKERWGNRAFVARARAGLAQTRSQVEAFAKRTPRAAAVLRLKETVGLATVD